MVHSPEILGKSKVVSLGVLFKYEALSSDKTDIDKLTYYWADCMARKSLLY